ncbi:pol protein [Cucumis melo var. makuwa]|uniref:Pol protein n=1 Tax=Cucumis melo var. makuwa TaxID=1194695 RepID=A0A5D3E6Q2_CUCMM|nr:pol protein [Cucumis melo var. makuwa]
MRQRRWLELVKDYDYEILYHPGKANVVADALSRKPTLRQKIIVAQSNDPYLVEKRCLAEAGQAIEFPYPLMVGFYLRGSTKMYQDLKRVYWWRNIKREVAEFVSKCLVRQQVKAPRQKPTGLLQPLSVSEWKWENVSMDFITRLPRTLRGFTVIWVVVDRLTKLAHFIPRKSTYTASKWAQLYMSEIARLHGVPVSIVSNRDARFVSKFWKGLQATMNTRLDFSTAFHPQIDGQTEHLNQVLEDMLRACALEFPGSWDSHLHLMEFAYNKSFQTTIGIAPFEALYGKCCRSSVCWDEVGEQRLMGHELVQSTNEAIQKIRSRMQTAQSRQKSYADVRRKDLEFDVGDKVFLKVSPMKGVLRFERRGKLSPRFVGPFDILERIGPVAYRLALPPSLSAVHDVFHVSMLRKYVTDPSHVVDYEPLEIDENLSYTEQPVEVLAREVKMLRNREIPLVKVLWRNHKVEEASRQHRSPSSISLPFTHTTALYPDLLRTPPDAGLSAVSASTARCIPSSIRCPAQSRGRRVSEVTLRFWGVTASVVGTNSPLFGYSLSKGFLTTGPRTEIENVVTHMLKFVVGTLVMELCRGGIKVRKPLVLPIDALGFELRRSIVRWFSIDCGVTVSFIYGVVYLTGMVSFGIPRLICVSFGITRLICASFRITRLICVSFGITKLICASFGITGLICASFGITRLICKGMARGRPTRGKKDA